MTPFEKPVVVGLRVERHYLRWFAPSSCCLQASSPWLLLSKRAQDNQRVPIASIQALWLLNPLPHAGDRTLMGFPNGFGPSKCGNQASGFFVLDNAELELQDTIVYKTTSEDDCIRTCSNNRDQFKREIECASFMYDHASFSCTIYKAKAGPVGNAVMNPSVGKRYFEKFCLKPSLPPQCADSQFIRVDDSVLVGYAMNLTVVDTLEDCVSVCVSEPLCKSAMFFYEDKECITNSESAITKPSAFTKEDIDRVVYFQNGCDMNKLAETPSEAADSQPAPGEPESELHPDEEDDSKVQPGTEQSESLEASGSDEVKAQEGTSASKVQETKSTSGTSPTSLENEEYDSNEASEGENEYEEEEVEPTSEEVEEPTLPPTTTSSTEAFVEEEVVVKKKKTKSALEKKYKKHPRNFASKTLNVPKHKKISKKQYEYLGEQEVVSKTVEESNSASSDSEEPSDELKPTKKSLKMKKVATPEEEGNYFSDWSDWTPCTKSGERQIRRRRCLDLRRCLGALMQVQNCPAILPTTTPVAIESVRSVVDTNGDDYDDASNFENITPPKPSPKDRDVKEAPAVNVWGPWQGTCQHFASSQPCNNGNMIGFESRECVAKDAALCEGPFFRYCTLSC
ncbi:unnamed protein product [Caenorhabditis auriculariae]|uniref:Apple domain-containing protein n=1 Tax=Caenorhabditis auriculariae TaxID=2777116 RepID=A0A8S1HUC8_9PELO|nr:unnamed protein product [Caenorhabditis auriculariae]